MKTVQKMLALFLLCGVALTAFTGCDRVISGLKRRLGMVEEHQVGATLAPRDDVDFSYGGIYTVSSELEDGIYYADGKDGTASDVSLRLEDHNRFYGETSYASDADDLSLPEMSEEGLIFIPIGSGLMEEATWTLVEGEQTVSGTLLLFQGQATFFYAPDPAEPEQTEVYAIATVEDGVITVTWRDGEEIQPMIFRLAEEDADE